MICYSRLKKKDPIQHMLIYVLCRIYIYISTFGYYFPHLINNSNSSSLTLSTRGNNNCKQKSKQHKKGKISKSSNQKIINSTEEKATSKIKQVSIYNLKKGGIFIF